MVAALTRLFGVHNLDLAEDVVQDAFCCAMEVWRFRGVPENPSAWLMRTAKNRALDVLRRDRTSRTLAPDFARFLESEWTLAPVIDEFFEPGAIQDGLLRMMFSCCNPLLAEESHVALVLHILCGFSVDEIANAFVSGRAGIEKRITRAKKVLGKSKRLFDIGTPADFAGRLPAVHVALYLLFNEGYHGASPESAVRTELCHEAMRLAAVLLEHPLGATPPTFALAALMSLNAARLPARLDPAGNLNEFVEQDRSQWDQELIDEGLKFLDLSATGSELCPYHVEAAIAAIHAAAPRIENTDWPMIVSLYDTLMTIRPSPIIALNRAIALAYRDGPEQALKELRVIEGQDRLSRYPFFPAALGELELRLGRGNAARQHFRAARNLARSAMESQFFDRRIEECDRDAVIRTSTARV
jgi:RNA polymerase sigma-70 factor (ECF subfamily)